MASLLAGAGRLVSELGFLEGVAVVVAAIVALRLHKIIDVILKHRREQRKISAKIEHNQKALQAKLDRRMERRSRRKRA